MSYTVEDYKKDFVREHLNLLSTDEVLRRYSTNDRIKDLSPDEVLKRYSLDDIIDNLSPEYLKALLEKLENKH